MLKAIFISALCLCLAGCIGDQHNSQAPSPPVINITPAPALAGPSKEDFEKQHSETMAAATTAQQSFTGLGANIASLQNKLTGVEGDLSAVKLQLSATMNNFASFATDIKASFTVNANLTAQIKTEMQANFDAKLAAQADVNANAVAALKSEITSMTQTISAGRDANTQNIQFTKEMQQTLEAGYKTQLSEIKMAFYALIAICHIWAGVVIAFLHGSVKHERKQRDLGVTRDARALKEVASGSSQ